MKEINIRINHNGKEFHLEAENKNKFFYDINENSKTCKWEWKVNCTIISNDAEILNRLSNNKPSTTTMKDLIKVRIEKCSGDKFWYRGIIGSEIFVKKLMGKDYQIPYTNLLISKPDCIILSDTGDKDEPKEWIPQVGEWTYILGTGHTENNLFFPKGEVFEISQVIKVDEKKYAISVKEGSKINGRVTNSIDCRKALPHEIPASEPIGCCIKRTPENAEVLNRYFSQIKLEYPTFEGETHRYYGNDGYLNLPMLPWNHLSQEVIRGYEECFTVEEFFEKVGYKPEPSSKEILDNSSEPVLIAKAGEEKIKPANQKSNYYKLFKYLSEEYDILASESELQEIIYIVDKIKNVPSTKEHKEETERIPVNRDYVEKPIDKVTIENLELVLRMCNIQIHKDIVDKIIDCVELIEDKGEEVTLMDVCKMQAQWIEVKRPVK